MLKTRKSNPNKPVRIMIYGVEGVGKSTLGARADKPIFISPEGGTDQLVSSHGSSIDEMPHVNNWDALRNSVTQLINEQHDFKTLVIDSADWVEKLAHAKIIGQSNKSIITCNGGYGTGYRESEKLHRELIEGLSILRDKRDMHIIVTAHAHVKGVKDPGVLEDYDSFEIKCHEMVSSLWREWVDGLFFVRFRTFSKTSDDSVRARALGDGTRVLYSIKQPAFQAKNRFGMPGEFEFTEDFWNTLMTYARKNPQESVAELLKEIADLSRQIDDEEIRAKIVASISSAGNISNRLKPIRDRLLEITKGEKQ